MKEEKKTFPRKMMVNTNNGCGYIERMVLNVIDGRAVTVNGYCSSFNEINVLMPFYCTLCEDFKEIEYTELTVSEIEMELGYRIKIVD